jgi:shikimate kinase
MDTDEEIVKRAKMTIPHIFEYYGEYYFRDLEAEVAREAGASGGLVIATGGGMAANERGIACLRATGMVFYLRASAEQVYRNTEHSTDRPLLNVPNRRERIAELLALREPIYRAGCDAVIHVDNREIKDIATQIYELYGKEIS